MRDGVLTKNLKFINSFSNDITQSSLFNTTWRNKYTNQNESPGRKEIIISSNIGSKVFTFFFLFVRKNVIGDCGMKDHFGKNKLVERKNRNETRFVDRFL